MWLATTKKLSQSCMSELKEGYQNLSVGQLGRLFGGSGGKMSSELLSLSRFLWQHLVLCFPCGSVVKNPPANAGDTVQKYPTCLGATKPVCHSYWTWALKPRSCNCWTHVLQPLKPVSPEAVLSNKRSHSNAKAMRNNWRLAPARRYWTKARAAMKTQQRHK